MTKRILNDDNITPDQPGPYDTPAGDRRKKTTIIIIVACLVALVLAGIGFGVGFGVDWNQQDDTPTEPEYRVDITAAGNVDSIVEGDTLQLEATAVITNGYTGHLAEVVPAFVWDSSAVEKASVSANGLVSGLAYGDVVISAALVGYENTFGTFELHIEAETIVIVSSVNGETTLIEAETLQLDAEVIKLDEDNVSQDVVWKVSDDAKASVSDDGLVTAIEYGEVSIIATSDNGVEGKIDLLIEARTMVGIRSQNDIGELVVGDEHQLYAEVSKADDPDVSQDVIWTSSDNAIATITNQGLIECLSHGYVTFTATHESGEKDDYEFYVHAITEVVISAHNDITTVEENETLQLSALVSKEDNPSVSQDVVWSVDEESIATVSDTGLLSAVHYGVVIVKATHASGAFDTITINVVAPVVVTISTMGDVHSIIETETLQLNASVAKNDNPAISQDVTWSVDEEDIATIDATGLLTPETYGDVVVTATHDETGAFDTFAVSIDAEIVVVVSSQADKIKFQIGETGTLTAAVTKANDPLISQAVVWTSSDPAICEIDENTGVLRGISAGNATLTATHASGVSDQITITIESETIVEIVPAVVTSTLDEKQKLQLNAIVSKEDEPTVSQAVTWTSSDPSKATVSSTGQVSAIYYGDVVITATARNGSGASATFELTIIAITEIQVWSNYNQRTNWMFDDETNLLRHRVVKNDDPTISQSVLWSSSNPGILTIDSAGYVTASHWGEVEITATKADEPEITTVYPIKIHNLGRIEVSYEGANECTVFVGDTITLDVLVIKPDVPSPDQRVIWNLHPSPNENATIDVWDGTFTALAPATVIVYAHARFYTDHYETSNPHPTAISISGTMTIHIVEPPTPIG